MLINFVAEKTNASAISSVALSPDGTRIVSGSDDGTINVWDLGAPPAQNCPSLTETDVCWLLSGRQTGAAEREDGRPQRMDHVGGVFPGRDQDRVRIG